MWLFSKKHKILETPFFEGFKDFHSHILPAVDDGVKTLDESLEVLAYFEQLGIAEVIFTPHVMVGVNDTNDAVEAAYAMLKANYKGGVTLSMASEYMLDSNFMTRYKEGARLIDKSHILVETSYLSAPQNLSELLYEVCSDGVTPIIAHPERYLYMPRDRYHTLHEHEYNFQLNILSFSNTYGDRVAQNAIYMLEQGLYSVMGTDIHGLRRFKLYAANISLSTKHIDMLLELKERGL